MTRPWSPDETDERIVEVVQKLDEHILELPKLAADASDSKYDHEISYAKAILAARLDEKAKSAGEREALATLAAAKELRRKMQAEMRYDTATRVVRLLTTQSDLLRTLAVSRRSADDGQQRR